MAFFFFIWGVSLTHPVLASFLCREFLLHIPCWLHLCGEFPLHIPCWLHFYLGSFCYTSHAGFIFLWGVSLTHPMRASIFNLGSFSYTSRAGFIFIWEVSLTDPMLACFLPGEFLLHIPCWLYFSVWSFFYIIIPCWLYFSVGSFSYTSRAGYIFTWGVSLTHPVLATFLPGEFLLHIPCWLYFCCVEFLLHNYTMLALFFCGEFLLHIPCRLFFF